jgi:pimeloyl-ACP methyl ester carboxylesterase
VPAPAEVRTELTDTACGPIEVARTGSGPPVLVIHGTPGGADSSISMGRFLADAGFEVIAPSRPGYLSTPLEGREEIDRQADLMAALLEALDIPAVGVLTWSGGGPSGYRLAVRHPARVTGLVAASAVSHRFPRPTMQLEDRLMMNTSAGNWMLRFLSEHAPASTVSATIRAEGDLSRKELKALATAALADEGQRNFVLTMAVAAGDRAHRGAGVDSDWEHFAAIDSLELERVGVPTLLIHGTADTDVPPEHSEFAAGAIPGAELLTLDRGTHLALIVHPEADEAQQRAIATLGGRAHPG